MFAYNHGQVLFNVTYAAFLLVMIQGATTVATTLDEMESLNLVWI